MRTERIDGAAGVAQLLRTMADGIENGEISVGAEIVRCDPQLSAVVDVSPGSEGEVLVVRMHLSGHENPPRPLFLEEELSHPGG